jgi:hypothetical protein
MMRFLRHRWQSFQLRRLNLRAYRLKKRIEFERWDELRRHMEHPQ